MADYLHGAYGHLDESVVQGTVASETVPVYFGTAPVGLVSDTLQIGRLADVSVIICRADYTPKSSFESINTIAAENKLPNMCVVLNGVDMSKKKYGYYYGYGRYGKYGHYGYATYGSYANSHYGNSADNSIKR